MIATRKIFLGILVPALFLLCGRASGTPLCPASTQVYVSSVTQIVCVDAAGNITVLLTALSTSNLGDIAFGPDGLLYFTDSNNAEVFRFDPKSSTAGTAATITPVATLPSGVIPTGLGFSSSNGSNNGDLYVNASTGVFLVPGVACVGCSPSLPITPTPAITFPSAITAGGIAFDVFSIGEAEAQLIVDQTHGTVLRSQFPFTLLAATPLVNVPSLGQGIFASFCKDNTLIPPVTRPVALVASGTTIQRLTFTTSLDQNGNLVVTVASQSTYADLGDTVQYFEVTADGKILAVTFSNGAGGIVWSVPPVKDSSGVPLCSGTPTPAKIVSLKGALQAKTPPDLLSDNAKGVAIGPTSITIKQTFDALDPSQVFDFGPHRLTLTYKQVLKTFSQSFTAVRSLPADISFTSTFPNNTVPMHFTPLGGFAVEYVTSDENAPVANVDYVQSSSAIRNISAFSTDDILLQPGVAHASGDTLLILPHTSVTFGDNVTRDFWFADQATGADTPCCSTFIVFNEALQQDVTSSFSLKSPTAQCLTGGTTPTCNPQFNIGQSVDFGFSTSATVPITARLSIAKVHVAADGTIIIDKTIDVFSKNNKIVDNFFNPTNNTYGWDSSGAEVPGAGPGLYQFTISSNFFRPQAGFLTLK